MFDTADRDVDCGAMYKVMMGCVMLVGWLCMWDVKSILALVWKNIIHISSQASML